MSVSTTLQDISLSEAQFTHALPDEALKWAQSAAALGASSMQIDHIIIKNIYLDGEPDTIQIRVKSGHALIFESSSDVESSSDDSKLDLTALETAFALQGCNTSLCFRSDKNIETATLIVKWNGKGI